MTNQASCRDHITIANMLVALTTATGSVEAGEWLIRQYRESAIDPPTETAGVNAFRSPEGGLRFTPASTIVLLRRMRAPWHENVPGTTGVLGCELRRGDEIASPAASPLAQVADSLPQS